MQSSIALSFRINYNSKFNWGSHLKTHNSVQKTLRYQPTLSVNSRTRKVTCRQYGCVRVKSSINSSVCLIFLLALHWMWVLISARRINGKTGSKMRQTIGGNLPYLLKILSKVHSGIAISWQGYQLVPSSRKELSRYLWILKWMRSECME